MPLAAFKFGIVGEFASYRARDGYGLIGKEPVCQSDSTWTALPKCISKLMCIYFTCTLSFPHIKIITFKKKLLHI